MIVVSNSKSQFVTSCLHEDDEEIRAGLRRIKHRVDKAIKRDFFKNSKLNMNE